MYRYGICDESGKVINVIVWDSVSNFTIPKGHQLIKADNINIGDTYNFETKELTKKVDLEVAEELSKQE